MAERYEGMLLKVTDSNGTERVSVTISNADASSEGDYGEFEVEGCLRVDDGLCEDCWYGLSRSWVILWFVNRSFELHIFQSQTSIEKYL